MSSIVAFHFWSPTCGPCMAIKPAVEDLKEDQDQIEWRSINTKNDPDGQAPAFEVRMVPTLVVTQRQEDGSLRVMGRHTGAEMIQWHRILRTVTSQASR